MRKIYKYNKELYTKDTPESMYFLGLVASDGCIDGYHIKIALDKNDAKLLEELRDSIVPGKPLYKSRETRVLKISCKPIMTFVKSSGITARKSLNLKLEDWVLESKNFSHFLRGFFDGDGTVVTEKANGKPASKIAVKICCGSKVLLEQLICAASKYGLNKNKVYDERDYGVMKYTCGQSKKFYDLIYRDCGIKLDRKYNKFNQLLALLG